MNDDLLDLAAACRFFGGSRPIHPATLYRGISQGRFPQACESRTRYFPLAAQ